jgi:hypothetical protein
MTDFVENPITKIRQVLTRQNGSEVRITATQMFGAGLHSSNDVYVHRRASANDDWILCSDQPHPNARTLSREQYLAFGRPEKFQYVSHGEILKLSAMLGQSADNTALNMVGRVN